MSHKVLGGSTRESSSSLISCSLEIGGQIAADMIFRNAHELPHFGHWEVQFLGVWVNVTLGLP